MMTEMVKLVERIAAALEKIAEALAAKVCCPSLRGQAMTYPEPEVTNSYEAALTIISNHGHEIASEECADIAHKGLIGDLNFLISWEAPNLGA